MSVQHADYSPCACPACSGQTNDNDTQSSAGERAPQMAPTFTDSQVIGQINSGAKWSGAQISYGFLTSAPSWDIGYEGNGFSAFTAYQANATRAIMSLWDDLVTPSFVEQTSSQQYANVKFGNTTTSINYAHAYYPGGYDWAGEVWLNAPTYNGLYYPDPGDYYWMTILHEVGHAIGLSHPGSYNGGSPTYANDAEYAQDTHQWTVMSYFSASNTVADWNGGSGWQYAQTPMIHDVLTVQSIYGADTTTRTGDTTYGFNSNAGNSVFDFAQNQSPVLTIYDAGGIDTLDLSGFSLRAIIDLEPGTYSSAGGTTSTMTYNIGIAGNTWIENAFGGSGNDTIYGNALGNELSGMGGSDQLYGYDGSDTISGGGGIDWTFFEYAFSNYTFQVLEASIQVIGEFVDTVLDDVERFSFSDFESSYEDLAALIGGPTTIEGSDLDDVLYGNDFVDVMNGNGGNDIIHALGGNDIVTGGAGNDTLIAGSGAGDDDYDGGDDIDTITYASTTQGVIVNLADGTASGPEVDSDTITNIENVIGGSGNDQITGDGVANMLDGGPGTDTLDGGGDTDTVSYANDAAGITARLDLGYGVDGGGAFDIYTSIEDVIGSSFADVLVGLAGVANTLQGGEGGDTFVGEGIDTILGGDGLDVFFGGQGSALNIDLAATSIETVWGSFVGDIMDGSSSSANLTLVGQGLAGGANADTMMGGSGNDFIYYRAGDVITGGTGIDWAVATLSASGVTLDMPATGFENAWGSPSGDTITAAGATSSVLIVGDAGNDILTGGSVGDFLYGFGDNDTLDGGGGNDNLIGGAGTDSFVFGANWGDDVIWDWQNDVELFNMAGSGAADYAALTVDQDYENSGNALVSFGVDQFLVIGGANQIDNGDFFF